MKRFTYIFVALLILVGSCTPATKFIVTNIGYSDWSCQNLINPSNEIILRIRAERPDFIVEYRLPGSPDKWTLIRIEAAQEVASKPMIPVINPQKFRGMKLDPRTMGGKRPFDAIEEGIEKGERWDPLPPPDPTYDPGTDTGTYTGPMNDRGPKTTLGPTEGGVAPRDAYDDYYGRSHGGMGYGEDIAQANVVQGTSTDRQKKMGTNVMKVFGPTWLGSSIGGGFPGPQKLIEAFDKGVGEFRGSSSGRTSEKNMIDSGRMDLATNPEGIIIDLRDNPGGYVDSALDILGYFIPEGEVIVISVPAG